MFFLELDEDHRFQSDSRSYHKKQSSWKSHKQLIF